ncbi:hypothetical protein [Streptomyces sp. SID12501]|uniref:Uncharacterized protein n=1 Tax=Streptomyces sp. SID12501 TaxID=2706042 RepID=A0A6B3BYY8_9ACTN|nr:hypothetical protein [Streptomyces sp. SID12501]NEC89350.1 hypothetical protein [Streptomyces sp. SID12501]
MTHNAPDRGEQNDQMTMRIRQFISAAGDDEFAKKRKAQDIAMKAPLLIRRQRLPTVHKRVGPQPWRLALEYM